MSKRVLLLGDSIRMFCQEKIKEELGEDYEVVAPSENCRFSLYTLCNLKSWLDTLGTPDVIHWNNGLWDTCVRFPEDGCLVPLGQYVENMKHIYRELQKTGAKIIFATTTPVHPEKQDNSTDDIRRYNEAVLGIFGPDITVNDLFSLVLPHIPDYLRSDMIHPSEAGIAAIARQSAELIRKVAGTGETRLS